MRCLAGTHSDAEPIGDVDGTAWETSCGDTRIISADAARLQLEAWLGPRDVVAIAASSRGRTERVPEIYETTKLQPWNTHMVKEIEELFEQWFDTEKFLETFGIGR